MNNLFAAQVFMDLFEKTIQDFLDDMLIRRKEMNRLNTQQFKKFTNMTLNHLGNWHNFVFNCKVYAQLMKIRNFSCKKHKKRSVMQANTWKAAIHCNDMLTLFIVWGHPFRYRHGKGRTYVSEAGRK